MMNRVPERVDDEAARRLSESTEGWAWRLQDEEEDDWEDFDDDDDDEDEEEDIDIDFDEDEDDDFDDDDDEDEDEGNGWQADSAGVHYLAWRRVHLRMTATTTPRTSSARSRT